ncbi:MAG TPA: hypothetical protein VFU40_02595 [Gemmatimonadales bacterium]|nr:hypothetical protein [Gemmatimonadales bacterium]
MKPLPFTPLDVGRALFTVAVVLTAFSVTGHALQYFYGTDRFLEYVRLFQHLWRGKHSHVVQFDCAVLVRYPPEGYREPGARAR